MPGNELRRIGLLCALTAACQSAPAYGQTSSVVAELHVVSIDRQPVAGDVAEYTIVISVGDEPHASLRLHRVVSETRAWNPRHEEAAVLLLHGDFATFDSNFHDLALFLAQRNIDVWGMDRRWAAVPIDETDFSDYADMNLSQAIADVERSLAVARVFRGMSGDGFGPIDLGGFSSGAYLAYLTAGDDARRAPSDRQVAGLIPIDTYVRIAPEDEDLRAAACARSADDQTQLGSGVVYSDNTFFPLLADLARTDPAGDSPLVPGVTNHDAFLIVVAQTYFFFAVTPVYHLNGAEIVDGMPARLLWSPEARILAWLDAAPPYQALAESADADALLCGEGDLPLDDGLEGIDVPLLYVGAAGGYGDHGLYTTTLVASGDVQTLVVRRLDAALEDQDFGHADLLYGSDAPSLAWGTIADWIAGHARVR